jgi:uncharacterized lipoprotein
MVLRLVKNSHLAWILLASLLLALAGCSGGETTPPETEASKAAANSAAGNWTAEQKANMQKALSERNAPDNTTTLPNGKSGK